MSRCGCLAYLSQIVDAVSFKNLHNMFECYSITIHIKSVVSLDPH